VQGPRDVVEGEDEERPTLPSPPQQERTRQDQTPTVIAPIPDFEASKPREDDDELTQPYPLERRVVSAAAATVPPDGAEPGAARAPQEDRTVVGPPPREALVWMSEQEGRSSSLTITPPAPSEGVELPHMKPPRMPGEPAQGATGTSSLAPAELQARATGAKSKAPLFLPMAAAAVLLALSVTRLSQWADAEQAAAGEAAAKPIIVQPYQAPKAPAATGAAPPGSELAAVDQAQAPAEATPEGQADSDGRARARRRRRASRPQATGPRPEQPPRSEVVAALKGLEDAVRACAGGRHGRAEVELTFRSEGRVSHANIGGDFAGSVEGSCIARAVRKARVPPFTKASVKVFYPYSL